MRPPHCRGRSERSSTARPLPVLRRGDGLFDQGGTLHARLPSDNSQLQRLLGRALPGPVGETPSGGSMTVQRRVTRTRLEVHVHPVGGGEAALVLVVDPARRRRIDPARVSTLLGLTAVEGRVSALPAEGRAVREMAAALRGGGPPVSSAYTMRGGDAKAPCTRRPAGQRRCRLELFFHPSLRPYLQSWRMTALPYPCGMRGMSRAGPVRRWPWCRASWPWTPCPGADGSPAASAPASSRLFSPPPFPCLGGPIWDRFCLFQGVYSVGLSRKRTLSGRGRDATKGVRKEATAMQESRTRTLTFPMPLASLIESREPSCVRLCSTPTSFLPRG